MNTKKIEKKPIRDILSAEERAGLTQTVKDHEAVTSKVAVDVGGGIQAGGDMDRTVKGAPDQVKRALKTLKDGEADSLNVYQKSKAEKRIDELNEILAKQMVPRKWAHAVPGTREYNEPEVARGISHMAKFEMSPEFVNLSMERKNLLRELGREDETDLEFIRP